MAFDTINTSTKSSTGQSYDNQYDVQRNRVRDEEAKKRKLEQEALQRALASRGFGAGTGFTEAQQNQLQQSSLAGERSRLRDIDINQLSAGEAAAEAEKGRTWQTGERLGTQEYSTGERLGQQQYGTAERLGQERYGTSERLGQQQYGTSERLGQQQYGTSERLGQEAYQAAEANKDRQIKLQGMADEMTKFASEQDFKYWAQESGYSEAEADRAWKTSERTGQEAYQSTEADLARNYEWDFTAFKNMLSQGNIDYAQAIEDNTAAIKLRTDYLFAAGQNGTKVNTNNLSQIEQDAYRLGQEGGKKELLDQFVTNSINSTNTAITTMVEHPELMPKIYEQFDKLNLVMQMISDNVPISDIQKFIKTIETTSKEK
jgi:hypothetical protein